MGRRGPASDQGNGHALTEPCDRTCGFLIACSVSKSEDAHAHRRGSGTRWELPLGDRTTIVCGPWLGEAERALTVHWLHGLLRSPPTFRRIDLVLQHLALPRRRMHKHRMTATALRSNRNDDLQTARPTLFPKVQGREQPWAMKQAKCATGTADNRWAT